VVTFAKALPEKLPLQFASAKPEMLKKLLTNGDTGKKQGFAYTLVWLMVFVPTVVLKLKGEFPVSSSEFLRQFSMALGEKDVALKATAHRQPPPMDIKIVILIKNCCALFLNSERILDNYVSKFASSC